MVWQITPKADTPPNCILQIPFLPQCRDKSFKQLQPKPLTALNSIHMNGNANTVHSTDIDKQCLLWQILSNNFSWRLMLRFFPWSIPEDTRCEFYLFKCLLICMYLIRQYPNQHSMIIFCMFLRKKNEDLQQAHYIFCLNTFRLNRIMCHNWLKLQEKD